jgi:hypothetical protein
MMNWKGSDCSLNDILFWYLPGRSEEDHETWYLGQDLNQVLPRYKCSLLLNTNLLADFNCNTGIKVPEC